MDRNERYEDREQALLSALAGLQARIWTALPAIIESFDPAKMTVQAQPAIQARVRSPEGVWSWVTMPLLVDVPVIYPSGGGFTLTFPIEAGDECLVLFSSRCIDMWWQSGEVQIQAELRMHDLSDGFALVGPRSQPNILPNISLTGTQLRNDDGTTFVQVSDGSITMTTPGAVTINAGSMQVSLGDGTMTVDADLLRTREEIIYRYPDNPHNLGASFTHLQEIYNEHTHDTPSGESDPPEPQFDWWPV